MTDIDMLCSLVSLVVFIILINPLLFTKMVIGCFYSSDTLLKKNNSHIVSRSKNVDLVFSSFSFSFYFPFKLFFHFSIFRTLGLGLEVIGHTVTPVTSNGVVITLIIGLKKRE